MAKNVNKFEELKKNFREKPGGFTPMSKIFNIVLKNELLNQPVELNEKPKKMLIVTVTDGEPTNSEGKNLKLNPIVQFQFLTA